MPAKWNFLPCFLFLVPLKIKVKNKTQNALITRDSQRSDELVIVLHGKILILKILLLKDS